MDVLRARIIFVVACGLRIVHRATACTAMVDLLTLTIYGQPVVKKNNQRVIDLPARNPRTGKPYRRKVDTAAYTSWHAGAINQLTQLGYLTRLGYRAGFAAENKARAKAGMPQMSALFNWPVNLQCKFFMKTNGRCDLSALYEGIQDVLVEVGVLSDDNWMIVASHDGSGVQKDAANPRMEITISTKGTYDAS